MGEEKAKILCSFGGEFVREQGRPFYLGGKTRLVSVDRSASFRSLLSKMAEICGADPKSVDVKFQLPDGGLDARLISVECDEDVRNMMDEFSTGRKIPVFLFTEKTAENGAEIAVADDDDDDDDGFAGIDGTFVDYLRETAIVNVVEPHSSLSGSSTPAGFPRRENDVHPSSGLNTSLETFRRDSQSLVVGQEFEDVQTFRNVLTTVAIAAKFEIHVIRSDSRRVTARCAAEGCTWRVHASKLPEAPTFRIKTVTPEHTCIKSDDVCHKQATAKWIASCIKGKLRQDRNYRPREIVDDIRREYGVAITYKRAFLGRERALEELRAEPVKEGDAGSQLNMDGQPWGEIHDPPRKKQHCQDQQKESRPLHCSRCDKIGHNKRTCMVLDFARG